MTRASGVHAFATAGVVLGLAFAMPVAAQDGFGRAAPRQGMAQDAPSVVAPHGRQSPSPQTPAMQDAPGEAQDFGVAPTRQLRASSQLGGPTPTSIPGGKVIATRELSSLLRGGHGHLLLLHAYGSPVHLPGAIAVAPAAQGGSFDDEVQQGFGQYLRQATGGDTSKMLVLYCGGPQCWGSYNASLRAIALGYRNVHWYRGGVQAWQQAGLPVRDAAAQGPAQGGRQ